MKNDKLLRPEEASKILNITQQSLINWTDKGKIDCVRTKGGHRRFLLSSILPLSTTNYKSTKRNICYCRVSTLSQKEDLERQIIYFRDKYPNHEIIKDIGSGINFKRKGFNSILDAAIKGDIGEIVVTHQDRLCRFGFELVKRIIEEQSNGKILVLDQIKTSPEQELVNDLVSIITVFSSRLYGLRSHKLKKQIKESTKKTIEDS
jgi:excisionase family DNA binding protein